MKNLTIRACVIMAMGGIFCATMAMEFSAAVDHAYAATDKALYYCPMHPTYTSNRSGDCPICNMKLVKRDSVATQEKKHEHGPAARTFTLKEILAMKPNDICLLHNCSSGKCLMLPMTEEAARAGKCPGCGENLGVFIKDAAPAGYASLALDAGKQKLIGVKTAPVIKREMTKAIRTSGKIARDPDLFQAQEEYLQALQAVKNIAATSNAAMQARSAKLLDSTRLKLKNMGLSDELIREVEQSGKSDRSLLYADAGGRVWLYAAIYEYEIPLVKVGDDVQVELPAMPGKKFAGKIKFIDTVLDPVTRSVRARSVLENPDGLLKPEMYVNATIAVRIGNVLAVRAEAVFATGEQNIVFVAKPDGQFEPRQVTLGSKVDDYYEVAGGLGEGEQVVTSGNFLIDSESRLKAALEGMVSGSGSGHQHGQ